MNRLIKFRVWDKSLNKFLTNDNTWEISEKQNYHDDYQGSCERFFCGLEEIKNNENLILQQFTGLVDKNNREIYEGDIISYPQDSNYLDKFDTMVIEWENDHDGFGGLNCGFRMGGDYSTKENTEVIGNIFETPDLIN